MANIYVRSTDGDNSDNGSTWALAKQTLAGAVAIDVAGDNIYVSQAHTDSNVTHITVAMAGTASKPTRLICVNDADQPPVSTSTAATIATTSGQILFTGSAFYVYGFNMNCGVGVATDQSITLSATAGSYALFKNCSMSLRTSNASSRIKALNATGGLVTLEDCTVSFSSPSQSISMNSSGALVWSGGSIGSDSAAISALFAASTGTRAIVSGVDLSKGDAGMSIFTAGSAGQYFEVRNCRLPHAWAGQLVSGAPAAGSRYVMYNCDSADTNYRLWIADYNGSIKSETSVVRTGGASDGATPLSWVMVSNGKTIFPLFALASPEIVRWNDTTGSAITVTIEIVSNEPLDNKQCWLEVQYLGTNGLPLSSFISSAPADLLSLATALASSSEEWATAGITGPLRQKISVTFTPQERGYVHAVVRLAEPNTTVYVDPLLTIT